MKILEIVTPVLTTRKKKNKLKTSYFLEKLERQIFTMKTGKTGKYEESQLA